MARFLRTFLAGVLALLPIAVTLFVVGWAASLLARYAGPGSLIGSVITWLGNTLGLYIAPNSTVAYLFGLAFIVGVIFLLGLLVESGLRSFIVNGLDWMMTRIPLVSTVYDLAKRFVAIVDRGGSEDTLRSMRPVWCFFGGEGSAAVLGLMPSPEPVMIGERSYLGLLVPSAPVPFGGALIYVPSEWVKPAEGGVERLMNVYVSMGVTPPVSIEPAKPALAKPKAKTKVASS